jgi:hypothetical protein
VVYDQEPVVLRVPLRGYPLNDPTLIVKGAYSLVRMLKFSEIIEVGQSRYLTLVLYVSTGSPFIT